VLNYFDVHKPYLPPEPYLTKFAASTRRFHETPMFEGADFTGMTPDQLQRDIDAYDGAIRFVDDAFESLLSELEVRKLRSNTIVIVTSDHGEAFGDHGIYTHRAALYLDEIRVPLIVSWPGRLPARRVHQPVSIAAVPATLLELIGETRPGIFPRRSVAPLWTGEEPAKADEPPIAELAHQPDEPFAGHPVVHGAMRSVVGRQYHLIVHTKFGAELYDWVADPRELNNLVGTPEGVRIAGELSRLLDLRLSKAAGVRRPGARP
jgi:arylsulfatase A-like enzyme